MSVLEFADRHPVWSFLALLVVAGAVQGSVRALGASSRACPTG